MNIYDTKQLLSVQDFNNESLRRDWYRHMRRKLVKHVISRQLEPCRVHWKFQYGPKGRVEMKASITA